jgi:hypothetical protein
MDEILSLAVVQTLSGANVFGVSSINGDMSPFLLRSLNVLSETPN